LPIPSARSAISDDIGEEVLDPAEVVEAADEQDRGGRDRKKHHSPGSAGTSSDSSGPPADLTGSVNLGNPEEVTVLELAERARAAVGAAVPIEFTERLEDDPQVRRPDISLARLELGWEPKVPLDTGLERMVAWASEAWTT
jgi:nucleoside-diphosphate-sugar epimerase